MRALILSVAVITACVTGASLAGASQPAQAAGVHNAATAGIGGGFQCVNSGPTHVRWNSLANWNISPGRWCINDSTMRMLWQSDGNLVIYPNASGTKALWASGTQHRGTRLSWQADGNMVIYRGNTPIWASGVDPDRRNGKLHAYDLELDRNLDVKTSTGLVEIVAWDPPYYMNNWRILWADYNLRTPPLR